MKEAMDESNAPTSCASISELTGYLRNECDPRTRESIQAHLVGCDECKSTLLDIAGFVAAAAEPSPATTDLIVERKWNEFQKRLRPQQKPQRWWPAWLASSGPMPAIAAVCLVITPTAVIWALLLQSKLSSVEVAYRRLSDQHDQANRSQQRVEAEIAHLRAPQLNLPVFDVLPSGSGYRSGAASHSDTFALPATGRFALVLSGASGHVSAEYSIVISNEAGVPVFSGQGLQLDNQGNLLMTIDRNFLPRGRYRLQVGEKTGSNIRPVANYDIRLVDQRQSPKIENPAQ